jgi:predicted kinase
MKQQKLYLIRGIPGSGKSTYSKTLGLRDHYEADMWFEANGGYDPRHISAAHSWCINKTREALIAGRDVVVSNTFTRHWEMNEYHKMAADVGATVVIKIMNGGWHNVHGVPDSVVQDMKNRFEF